jgi:hypothetical protein
MQLSLFSLATVWWVEQIPVTYLGPVPPTKTVAKLRNHSCLHNDAIPDGAAYFFVLLSCVLACHGVPPQTLTGVLIEIRICLLLCLTNHWFAGCS